MVNHWTEWAIYTTALLSYHGLSPKNDIQFLSLRPPVRSISVADPRIEPVLVPRKGLFLPRRYIDVQKATMKFVFIDWNCHMLHLSILVFCFYACLFQFRTPFFGPKGTALLPAYPKPLYVVACEGNLIIISFSNTYAYTCLPEHAYL